MQLRDSLVTAAGQISFESMLIIWLALTAVLVSAVGLGLTSARRLIGPSIIASTAMALAILALSIQVLELYGSAFKQGRGICVDTAVPGRLAADLNQTFHARVRLPNGEPQEVQVRATSQQNAVSMIIAQYCGGKNCIIEGPWNFEH
jgi:hypothetical protein